MARKISKVCYLYILFAYAVFSSCHTSKQLISKKNLGFTSNYCAPTIAYNLTAPTTDTIHSISFPISDHDKLVCAALGISAQADSLYRLGTDHVETLTKIRLRESIIAKILVAQSQIQSVAAELDCEGERANLAADYLDKINNNQKNLLTAASVGLGALTTVATIIISAKAAQTTIGISGGVVSAGLAALTINPKGKSINFYHHRNLLHSIWFDNSKNTDYPYFVWRMLHEKQLSNEGNITLANSIRKRWIRFNFNEDLSPIQEKLLFGDGGSYHAEELHTRSALINQLQATIRSINQDLAGTIVLIQHL